MGEVREACSGVPWPSRRCGWRCRGTGAGARHARTRRAVTSAPARRGGAGRGRPLASPRCRLKVLPVGGRSVAHPARPRAASAILDRSSCWTSLWRARRADADQGAAPRRELLEAPAPRRAARSRPDDVEEALLLADRVLVMREGVIARRVPPVRWSGYARWTTSASPQFAR